VNRRVLHLRRLAFFRVLLDDPLCSLVYIGTWMMLQIFQCLNAVCLFLDQVVQVFKVVTAGFRLCEQVVQQCKAEIYLISRHYLLRSDSLSEKLL